MAPKRGSTVGGDAVPADAPNEEDDEGPGKVVFSIEVSGIANLPMELETCVAFGGACRPNKTAAAPASTSPSGWDFLRPHFIRKVDQTLFDDLCGRELVISVRDVGNIDAVVGEARLSLQPLLHEQTELGGALTLQLSPEYANPPKDDDMGKTETMKKSKSKAAPKVASSEPSEPWDPSKPSVITVRVSVPQLVGPPQDRENWVKVTAGVKGVFALPEPLVALNGGDVEAHPLRYQGALLAQVLGEGALAKPAGGADEAATGGPDAAGGEHAAVAELPEPEWRSLQERSAPSVRFKGGDAMVWYRGADFIRDFQDMLNNVGGVWFHLALEEKAPPDPKKAAQGAPDIASLARRYGGKAWLDLTSLVRPGVHSVEACCPLQDTAEGQPDDATTLRASRSFVSLSLLLDRELTPKTPAVAHTPLQELLPERPALNKFPSSDVAAAAFRGAVRRGFGVVCQELPAGVQGGPPGAVDALKEAGVYKGCKEDIRRAVVGVLRERIRKDTTVIPGEPLERSQKGDVLSGAYTYLTATIAEVLDELRAELPPTPAQAVIKQESANKTAGPDGFSPGGRALLAAPGGSGAPWQSSPSQSARSGGQMNRWTVAMNGTPSSRSEEQQPAPAAEERPPQDSRAVALEEADEVVRAREALGAACDAGERCKRLAYEAEILGLWDRAAQHWQSRLLIPEFRDDPGEWLAYAKFCSRSRGRQAAAEEALAHARALLESGEGLSSLEAELMLGSLLLDRGRHSEAIQIFRSWHAKDLAEPTYLFFLGFALFLAGEGEESEPLLRAAGMPRDWFEGLEDDAAIAEKLGAPRPPGDGLDLAPYADCLGQLLDFGLPSLAFTFLDQCGTLPEAALQQEPFALLDARATAMDGDHAGALERLKPLLDSNQASRDAWRLGGECYVHLHDVDKALPVLQKAVSFEQQIEDAAFHVTLGGVLLAKKRWKQARESFVRSLQCRATAEAWLGVAYAEHHGGDLQLAHEALCEANLLDDQRPKVWAQFCLLHLRLENWASADDSCRSCLQLRPDSDCDIALQEVATEYVRLQRQPVLAEAAARSALEIRESGPALGALADALGQQGRAEEAVDAAEAALEQLVHQRDARGTILGKGLKVCEAAGRADLQARLQEAQRAADAAQHADRPSSTR